MAEAATAAVATGGVTAGKAKSARAKPEIYRAGALRTIVFSLVFLLLLPFFVSLGPMLFWRITHGHWIGTPGLIMLAVGFSLIMLLIFIELVFSIRSRVALGEQSLRLTLPKGRFSRPLTGYQTRDIPYSDIDSVEIRREVYGGAVAPVMMKGARIRLKSGEFVPLGYVNEANVDPTLPFPEIGERIAAKAGVPIVDGGDLHRSAMNKLLGIPARGDQLNPIAQAEIGRLNRRHNQVLLVLVGALVVLVGVGIVSDHDSDIGHAGIIGTLLQGTEPAATPAAGDPPPAGRP